MCRMVDHINNADSDAEERNDDRNDDDVEDFKTRDESDE